MSSRIRSLKAREILDSRGDPTIEVAIETEDGVKTKASVPSGATMGSFEALELRDGDPKRYGGQGVRKAVSNVNTKIAKALIGFDVANQEGIDRTMIELDGTPNKSKLGANAMLGASLAAARAAAMSEGKSLYWYFQDHFHLPVDRFALPIPMLNIFNGGKHADTNLDVQEIMIVPVGLSEGKGSERSRTFSEMLEVASDVFRSLGVVLKKKGYDTDVGIEGGYAPDIESTMEAMDMIMESIERSGYRPGKDVSLALDVGAPALYSRQTNEYIFRLDHSFLKSHALIQLYQEWCEKYPILSIEDGLDENDWDGWRQLTKEVHEKWKNKPYIVADDLFATNAERLVRGIREKAGDAVIIKPNQVGTVSETIETIKLAHQYHYTAVMCHRSGETNDDFIADFAVGSGAKFIKAGSITRGERLAKYNRLLEIEEEIR
ncbi:phosphopyruvate hydratase [Candidatus Kaiserbacteria bacterium RIFCSPHIGHO2_01_FULL_48_10]|uniref:Enolase n=1 Tax=Candidatus Kaiserbacteria bacterium RIFCSPHIGHO2_01_FULL_48_10 TaxID=1798476 RepID=A0A1F6C4V3_9BACT|nr:MAG: phosphopyruvate hydratase [Candidatus Kaiserbacteria bacterium RIFCSPHIGHO2_01_FULL_48_10]HLC99965.1 phosphopyruvate hydratase [Patescibacteria group bacterium]